MNKHRFALLLWSVVRGCLVLGICFMIIYPVIVKISTSFMGLSDLYDNSVLFIPRDFNIEGYRIAWRFMNYPKYLVNTVCLSLGVSILQAAACTLIGYGLARFNFPGSRLLFILVILALVVPPQMIMIPVFLNFRFFDFYGILKKPINLLGTYWPFIITAATGMGLKNGLFIYIIRQHFRSVPKDLEEAALVDGAGIFRTFYKIMLPSATSVLLIVFLFGFVWQWNDVYYSQLYLRDSGRLLSFGLESIRSSYSDFVRSYPYAYSLGERIGRAATGSEQEITIINNAGMVLFITPLLIMYAFLQKFFVESIERTGLVG